MRTFIYEEKYYIHIYIYIHSIINSRLFDLKVETAMNRQRQKIK